MAAGIGSMTFDDDLAADGFGSGQIDEIFGSDDELFNAPAPLPPLSPTNIDAGANEGGGEASASNDDKTTKKKVINRSPQPKLDDVRLCSERGIPALAHLCDGIKFKGKGHEASDLNVLLQRFEHWAHRLYPKFPFQDCVDQIEALGNKKLVQNTIKAVRRGETGEIDDNNTDEEGEVNGEKDNDDVQSVMNDENFGEQIQIETSNTPVPQLGLTPEQQERIRLNRERALARRKQQQSKLASQDETLSQADENQPASSCKPDEASQETTLPDAQSPERSKLSFENELEETDETQDKKETRAVEDETMENNDNESNKNLTKCDDDKMETEEPDKTCTNNIESKTKEDDVALVESIENTETPENADIESLKADVYVSMDTECIKKSTDLGENIDDISMET